MYYYAGATRMPGTNVPSNVTGDCPHRHRSPEAAERCIASLDQYIKRGHGQNAYADRYVMVYDPDAQTNAPEMFKCYGTHYPYEET